VGIARRFDRVTEKSASGIKDALKCVIADEMMRMESEGFSGVDVGG
jgi:hypothetical protein